MKVFAVTFLLFFHIFSVASASRLILFQVFTPGQHQEEDQVSHDLSAYHHDSAEHDPFEVTHEYTHRHSPEEPEHTHTHEHLSGHVSGTYLLCNVAIQFQHSDVDQRFPPFERCLAQMPYLKSLFRPPIAA